MSECATSANWIAARRSFARSLGRTVSIRFNCFRRKCTTATPRIRPNYRTRRPNGRKKEGRRDWRTANQQDNSRRAGGYHCRCTKAVDLIIGCDCISISMERFSVSRILMPEEVSGRLYEPSRWYFMSGFFSARSPCRELLYDWTVLP